MNYYLCIKISFKAKLIKSTIDLGKKELLKQKMNFPEKIMNFDFIRKVLRCYLELDAEIWFGYIRDLKNSWPEKVFDKKLGRKKISLKKKFRPNFFFGQLFFRQIFFSTENFFSQLFFKSICITTSLSCPIFKWIGVRWRWCRQISYLLVVGPSY